MSDMTRQEIVDRLKQIAEHGNDPEGDHADADRLLCEWLRQLGYSDIVEAYHSISPKWYA